MHKTLLLPTRRSIFYVLIFLTFHDVFGQVVVFSDDFTDNTDPAWTTSGNLSGSAWTIFRSGDDWGARRNDSPFQLELTNDVGTNTNLSGFCLASTSSSSFTAPYNTTLENGGVVTWTFNMRQIRPDPSGFTSANYGVAFILAGETVTNNSTGNGYAVVLGQTGDIDPIRLVRYTTGLNSDIDLTNLITSNTSGLTDFGIQHLSIKVTYNPCIGGQWELFLRNDDTSFMDPLSGTLISQGTVIDSTYTDLSLEMMAAYWKGSITAGQTSFFSNVTVSANPIPSFNPGSNPAVCSGISSTNLSYTSLAGSPDQYDINWDAAAEAEGFVDVTSAALPVSPISLTVPGAAAPDTYSSMLTLVNSGSGCESDPYPITVTINPLPVVTCPASDTLCSDEPAFILSGGTPSGGVYSGTGVSGNMFNPGTAPPGINVITYTYTDPNLCSNDCTFSITVNTAPVINAGTYGPACLDGADIVLIGSPSGGTWSGAGVTGNMFDPSFGTQTLTYTYFDLNGCGGDDETTITVTSCAPPSTMQWLLLEENDSNGSCTSTSDCENNRICYGLEYTPLYTGNVTSYTTRWWAECHNGADPVISNISCTMTNNSNTIPGCSGFGLVIMNSSGNTGNVPVTKGIPVILHQVCFVIPNTGSDIDVYPDTTIHGAPPLTVSIDSVNMGGFEDDTILNKIPLSIDSLSDCTILPLRWLSFTAAPLKEFVSDLKWMTAEEFNTDYFDVQRSNDGGHTFNTIGQVKANGSGADVHTYHFVDEHAWAGKNFYRLKQMDFDGRHQNSPIRDVTFDVNEFSYKVFPNPANDYINIQLYKTESAGDIQLVDITGNIIITRSFEPGTYSFQLPLPSLPSGFYHLTIRTGVQHFVEKLMIIGTGR